MSGLIKNFMRKLLDVPLQNEVPVMPVNVPPVPVAAPATVVAPPCNRGARQSPNAHGLELPLPAILAGLPLELRTRVEPMETNQLLVSVPIEKILPQLSRGVVQIAFGDLRQAAPGVFTSEHDRDQVLVPLPLGEILARLNPALITRRRVVQRQVEVPDDISSPFDPHGRGLIFSISPAKPKPVPLPASRQTALPLRSPVAPVRNTTVPFSPPSLAAMPLAESAMISTTRVLREPSTAAPPAIHHPVPQTPKHATDSGPLVVGLALLAEGWPEAVRQEIIQSNLVDAKVALPSETVERALKQGRIAFSWKTVRSWIKPAPLPSVSAHDGTVLELPLKVIAPLFLARQKEANKLQQKVSVDESIPNLFFGFPQSEAANAAVSLPANLAASKPADTNYYVWDDSSDTVHVRESEVKREPTPGTKFASKYATPNEVVSRAAALDGVAGALIALPDGLMVASRLSQDLNADTLAAFLPQIFGRVSQCTKELRMGDLNNLHFTVGNIPWKIFRVNAIFFAAFGRPGKPLPTTQLAALAAELDHKPK